MSKRPIIFDPYGLEDVDTEVTEDPLLELEDPLAPLENCQCHLCGEVFFGDSDLKLQKHMEGHQLQVKEEIHVSYCCGACDALFSTPGGLNLHSCPGPKKAETEGPDPPRKAGSKRKQKLVDRVILPEPAVEPDPSPPPKETSGRKKEGIPGPFLCDLCGRIYKSKCSMLHHQKDHKVKPTKKGPILPKIKCLFCPYETRNPDRLCRHNYKHTGEHYLSCEACGETFGSMVCLRRHIWSNCQAARDMGLEAPSPDRIKERKLRNNPYKQTRKEGESESAFEARTCPFCKGVYPRHSYRLSHEQVHGEGHPCSLCPASYKSAVNLKSHQNQAHLDELKPQFSCSECGKKFLFKKQMWTHKAKHKREGPRPALDLPVKQPIDPNSEITGGRKRKYSRFKCSMCPVRTSTRFFMKLHEGQHGPGFPCMFCTCSFTRKDYMVKHKYALHSEKNKQVRTFTCRVCGMTFAALQQHSRHYRIHLQERQRKNELKEEPADDIAK